jgi:hypothetical protein
VSDPTCSADVQRELAEAQTAAMNEANAAAAAAAEKEAAAAMAALVAEEAQDNT